MALLAVIFVYTCHARSTCCASMQPATDLQAAAPHLPVQLQLLHVVASQHFADSELSRPPFLKKVKGKERKTPSLLWAVQSASSGSTGGWWLWLGGAVNTPDFGVPKAVAPAGEAGLRHSAGWHAEACRDWWRPTAWWGGVM